MEYYSDSEYIDKIDKSIFGEAYEGYYSDDEYIDKIDKGIFCLPCTVNSKPNKLVYRTCKEVGCDQIPLYNTKGESIGLYCQST